MSVSEFGHHIGAALKSNGDSWPLLNLAAMYWRAEGNSSQSIECLRRAFYHGPSHSKDVALVSLANVLHLGGYTVDALTAVQMAIQVTCQLLAQHADPSQVSPKEVLSHLTMANVLASLGERGYEEAAFFLEVVLVYSPNHSGALDRLLTLRCRQLLGRHGSSCDV